MPPPLDATPADFPPPSTIRPNPDYVPAYVVQPAAWLYDIDQANGLSRATYIGEVFIGSQAAGNQVATKGDIAAATTGVSTWNGRSGAVVMSTADITGAGGAPANSPTFAGVPNAPTAAPGTNTTQLATCMFVTSAIGAVTAATVASFNGRVGAVTLSASDVTTAGGALTASPAFTGTPTAPTPTTGNASSLIATTQFVSNAIANAVVSWNGRTGNVTMTLSDVTSVGGAPINSPNFTGTPQGATAAPGTATTQLATTAFVTNAVSAATTGVSTWNGRSGAVTLQLTDVTGVGGAPLVSPSLTGTPLAPTATAGTNTTQIATTAFVATAIGSMAPVVTQWNGRTGSVSLQLADVTSVGGAPLASPTFTGTPAAPTPTAGDNSTRVATTAFVANAIAPLATTAAVAAAYVPLAGNATVTGPLTVTANGGNTKLNPSSGVTLTATGNLTTTGSMNAAYITSSGNADISGTLGANGPIVGSYGRINSNAGGAGIASINVWSYSFGAGGMWYGPAGTSPLYLGTTDSSGSPTMQWIGIGNWGINYPQLGNGVIGYAWSGSALVAFVDHTNVGNVSLVSDYRIKRDVRVLGGMWEVVKALRPVSYRLRDYTPKGADEPFIVADDAERWGFVAHELQDALIPDAATGEKDAEGLLQAPNAWPVVAALTKALQEAMERIEALEAHMPRKAA